MADASDSSTDRQLDLLRIVCAVAWADGDVSPKEKQLLERLVARYFPPEAGEASSGSTAEAARQLAAWALDPQVLDEAIARLETEEDRLLAQKLGYMMARVGQRPGDSSSINTKEKIAYRRLVEGLSLSPDQAEEVEWAAERELEANKGPWAALKSALAGLGAWPDDDLLETPGATRL